jgi:hypothetical protein
LVEKNEKRENVALVVAKGESLSEAFVLFFG